MRFPKDDNKITSALTYEGIAGRGKIGPDRIAKHGIEAGNGPFTLKLIVRPQASDYALNTVRKIPQIAVRIKSRYHAGGVPGVAAPHHP